MLMQISANKKIIFFKGILLLEQSFITKFDFKLKVASAVCSQLSFPQKYVFCVGQIYSHKKPDNVL